jgi:hypothetical protein
LIFVTQPMNGMSPVDNKFFELIIPVATFLTGTLSGIMLAGDDKDLRGMAIGAANKPYTPPPEPPSVAKYVPTSEPMTPPVSLTPVVAVAQPVTGFGGKPAPVQPPYPEI